MSWRMWKTAWYAFRRICYAKYKDIREGNIGLPLTIMESEKKNTNMILVAIGVIVLAALVFAGFYYWRSKKAVPEPSATQALEEIESASPEVGVPASPVEDKIPSLNPVERVNPFKYENPLR